MGTATSLKRADLNYHYLVCVIVMIEQKLSHYRIVDQIGVGGMGVVYLAHDEQLDRDVAIKVLFPGSLTDEGARKRFRKEALSLARLNHPNIATVHEFGTQEGSDFLVTEYIAGTTMSARVAQGPLSAAEVARLGMQLADGLSAAHQQDVVHRDLKPANLRVTTDGRLKIIDFGIAQFAPRRGEVGSAETVSQLHELSGTLPYMAPEQLRGAAADPRSDLWSAGAVLYELATGQRPFTDKNPAVLINSIQNGLFVRPSQVNPAVPQGLEKIILKTLAKDPADRYQSAMELGTDLERLATTGTVAVDFPSKRKRLRLASIVAVALAGAAFLAAIGGYLLHERRTRTSASSTVNRRRTIAVLGFKNLSGKPDQAWLSTALSEMLTTELSQGDQLRTIPGESVAQMKLNLSLPDEDSFGRETLNRIRQNLGSDDVVLGSYFPLGDGQLRLDLRLQDAIAGETLVAVSEKGQESEIDQLVSRAGAELRAKLGIGGLSDAQSAIVKASLPSNPEAARLYSEGLQRLRVFDALAATDYLKKAAALDPEHAPTYSALAQAWSTLGYESKAKGLAQQALGLSARFSREERLLIEGRAHELSGDTAQAIESYRALWEFFPDNIDYGLLLIRSQVAGGHAADAESTLGQMRKLAVSEADAARIDLAQASIAASLSNFREQQSLAEQAAGKGRAIGANLLVAQALQLEANAWERLGQLQKTMELSHEARDLFTAAGDRRGAAITLLNVGDVLFDRGDFANAKKRFEEALPVFQKIGAKRNIRSTIVRIGNIFYSEGRLRDSEKYYEQSLQLDQELNNPDSLAGDYGNLANALDGLGDLQGALKMQQQSLSAFNQVGDRRGAATTLSNLGNLFVETGDLDQAKRYFEQSLAKNRDTGFRHGEAYPIAGLGDALLAQGDLAGSRKQYEQAIALCKELNDEDFTAELEVTLATIALYENRYSDGEALATKAATFFSNSNSMSNGAWSHAVLARNLLGAGKLREAQSAAEKAMALSGQNTGATPRFEAVLAEARVRARLGKWAEARQELESMLATARKFGYRPYEYQARLALGELDLWSGSAGAAGRLSAIETDARAQGFLLVANQAHALSQAK